MLNDTQIGLTYSTYKIRTPDTPNNFHFTDNHIPQEFNNTTMAKMVINVYRSLCFKLK